MLKYWGLLPITFLLSIKISSSTPLACYTCMDRDFGIYKRHFERSDLGKILPEESSVTCKSGKYELNLCSSSCVTVEISAIDEDRVMRSKATARGCSDLVLKMKPEIDIHSIRRNSSFKLAFEEYFDDRVLLKYTIEHVTAQNSPQHSGFVLFLILIVFYALIAVYYMVIRMCDTQSYLTSNIELVDSHFNWPFSADPLQPVIREESRGSLSNVSDESDTPVFRGFSSFLKDQLLKLHTIFWLRRDNSITTVDPDFHFIDLRNNLSAVELQNESEEHVSQEDEENQDPEIFMRNLGILCTILDEIEEYKPNEVVNIANPFAIEAVVA